MTELYYKALGDSLTTGVGSFFSKGFVSQYASAATKHLKRPIRTEMFAANKLTSGNLLYRLQDKNVQSRLMYGNIFTITTGGNDLINANKYFNDTYDAQIFHITAEQFHSNVTEILLEIERAKATFTTPYFIRLIGLYNPYPQLSYSHYWVSRFNQVLLSFEKPHIRYVDIYTPFYYGGEQLLSFRGIHPNRQGYEIIADQIVKKGFSPLK